MYSKRTYIRTARERDQPIDENEDGEIVLPTDSAAAAEEQGEEPARKRAALLDTPVLAGPKDEDSAETPVAAVRPAARRSAFSRLSDRGANKISGRPGRVLPSTTLDLRSSLSRRSAVPYHMLNALNNVELSAADVADR